VSSGIFDRPRFNSLKKLDGRDAREGVAIVRGARALADSGPAYIPFQSDRQIAADRILDVLPARDARPTLPGGFLQPHEHQSIFLWIC